MKLHKITSLIAAAATLCTISAMTSQAQAAELYKGWNYSIDAVNDGSGGSAYDIRGIAIKEEGDQIIVALTGGASVAGVAYSSARNGNIGWGDMFFNFSGKSFAEANASGSLFGVRFAGTNDSGAASVGVYSNVKATSVALANSGYSSLQQYYDHGFNSNDQKAQGDLNTRADVKNYYGNNGTGPINNVISAGTKVGEVSSLTSTVLAAAGLDFGHFAASGSQTFAFSFSKSAFGNSLGAYIANVFMECGNDGTAIKSSFTAGGGNPAQAPEPAEIAGTALAVLGFAGMKLRQRRQGKVNLA